MMSVKPVRESIIEQELVRRVKRLGGRADKVMIIGKRGMFDRLVVLREPYRVTPRIIFVEVKRPHGGRASPQQIVLHAAYRALGAEVVTVRNLADIDRLIGPEK